MFDYKLIELGMDIFLILGAVWVGTLMIKVFKQSYDKTLDRVMEYLEKKDDRKDQLKLVKDFDHYYAILTYHMEAAFEIIHKDNILVYSLDGVKPREEDLDNLAREFVKLVMRLVGPNMFEVFTDLFGDEDTLFFIIMDYFNRRFEDDEIRASAIDNLKESEEI